MAATQASVKDELEGKSAYMRQVCGRMYVVYVYVYGFFFSICVYETIACLCIRYLCIYVCVYICMCSCMCVYEAGVCLSVRFFSVYMYVSTYVFCT